MTGSVEVGKCADLIVTKENPLESLEALRKIEMVIANGKLFKNPTVKKMKKVEDAFDLYN